MKILREMMVEAARKMQGLYNPSKLGRQPFVTFEDDPRGSIAMMTDSELELMLLKTSLTDPGLYNLLRQVIVNGGSETNRRVYAALYRIQKL